ncbi:Alpha-amylase [Hordeum vulgare]|nr:Alpha-amylase [Hordeum vulgare]
MVTVSDDLSATSGDRGNSGGDGGEQITTRTDLEGFFDQLDINEEEFEDVFIDEEDPMMQESVSKTKDINTFHMPIWLQIHKLPEEYCKDHIMEKLLKSAGEIMEMRLNGNIRGDYVRVRVNHDIREPLTKYASIVRGKERQVYFVRYEKLAKFCKFCGLVGHDYKECGTGIHEEKSLKFGGWLYADAPNKSRGDTQSAHTYKGSIPGEQQQQMPIKGGPATKAKEPIGPVTMDIATCPVIPLGCSSSGEKESMKRLNLDAANGVGTTTTPPLRNDQTHGKEIPPVSSTVEFLDSYYKSIKLAGRYSVDEILKGKMPSSATQIVLPRREAPSLPWSAPSPGYAALSVDGSFQESDSSAAAGMVLRDHEGHIIFAAYRALFYCKDALEAEIHALMQARLRPAALSHAPCSPSLASPRVVPTQIVSCFRSRPRRSCGGGCAAVCNSTGEAGVAPPLDTRLPGVADPDQPSPPYAELWMGTQSATPSVVLLSGDPLGVWLVRTSAAPSPSSSRAGPTASRSSPRFRLLPVLYGCCGNAAQLLRRRPRLNGGRRGEESKDVQMHGSTVSVMVVDMLSKPLSEPMFRKFKQYQPE